MQRNQRDRRTFQTNTGFVCSLLLLAACHPSPPHELELAVPAGPAADAGACVQGFTLSNRYLGEVFLLQSLQVKFDEYELVLAPLEAYRGRDVLWRFERRAPQSDAFRLYSVAFPDRLITNDAALVLAAESEASWWLPTPKADPGGQNSSATVTTLLRAESAPGNALGTNFAPPYTAQLVPGSGELVHEWLVTPRVYCGSGNSPL